MPATPLHVLPYPQDTDPVSDGALAIANLALAVDTELPRVLGCYSAGADSSTTTTERIDDACPSAPFLAVSGHSYTISSTGQNVMTDVANDLIRVLIRDGGQSGGAAVAPTTSSPSLVSGTARPAVAGTSGKTAVGGLEVTLKCPSEIAAGWHSVNTFIARGGGTGNVSLSAPTGGKRQIKVKDEGRGQP